MNWIDDLKYDIGKIKSSEKELKKFGILVGAIFLTGGLISLWHHWFHANLLYGFCIGSVVLILAGLLFPKRLKVFYALWMIFAIVIGSLVSRIILFVLFFVILTPVSVAARIFGKSFVLKHKDRQLKSYWIKRNTNKKINYERMH